MVLRDLAAWTVCDPITSEHGDGLYWVILLGQIGSVGKSLGIIVLINNLGVLDLPEIDT